MSSPPWTRRTRRQRCGRWCRTSAPTRSGSTSSARAVPAGDGVVDRRPARHGSAPSPGPSGSGWCGPLAEGPTASVFERAELDGREHSAWVLRAEVWRSPARGLHADDAAALRRLAVRPGARAPARRHHRAVPPPAARAPRAWPQRSTRAQSAAVAALQQERAAEAWRDALGGEHVVERAAPRATCRRSPSSSGVGEAGRDLVDVVGDQHERRASPGRRRGRRAGRRAPRGRRGRGRRTARRAAPAPGSIDSARASSTRWRSPEDSVAKVRPARWPAPKRSSAAAVRGLGRRRRTCATTASRAPLRAVRTMSRAVMPGRSRSATAALTTAIRGPVAAHVDPAQHAAAAPRPCPADGCSHSDAMRTRVVLPEPFGPSTTQRSPGADLPVDPVEDGAPVPDEPDALAAAGPPRARSPGDRDVEQVGAAGVDGGARRRRRCRRCSSTGVAGTPIEVARPTKSTRGSRSMATNRAGA